MKVDILAFGVHPDDVELGCSGTLIASAAAGKKVAVIDLTGGELGTRGTIETRKTEAADAAKIMRLSARENLFMADGFFQNDETNIRKVITVIRKYKPEIVLCNAPEDRHPDHGRSSKLVADAAFLSGLRKIETSINDIQQEHWRPSYVFHYIQDRYLKPDFVFDISAYFEEKIKSILCYKTQFNTTDTSEPETYISNPDFLETIKGRALMFGKRIGVKYAEGYLSAKTPGVSNFDAFIQQVT
ncbi:bacillithiol biosynthesis deacetylase BshB1 [Panacibacter ginsenosidivorans]|uniref:Bacillithiol biosynthesis deacetylase BshB1 n=1 Tax=Panacibacter ginsenosidivorans TaxID=1813871 RepID=A0A5B8VGU1_9BACT|nr:bacillithiol biosynthesis deacetylase BshB1 [Panacibacter ginsenosidivorans]QEC69786.1 bacillithiol biosynthesis deacetylase BshB1 [Panacibacter ginsenosidivorans]